jgi:hypothetical protein
LPIRSPRFGYGYVTSRMGTSLTGDPREVALRNAVYAAVHARAIERRQAALNRLVAPAADTRH